MKLLVLYLGVTIVGYFLGSWMRKKNKKIRWAGKVQGVAVTILILLMGMRLGANKEIIEGLSSIGFIAFVLVVFAIMGSIGGIFLARKLIGLNRKGVKIDD